MRHPEAGNRKRAPRTAALGLLLLFGGAISERSLAQEVDAPDPEGSRAGAHLSLPSVLKSEVRRYLLDGTSILSAPLHWDGGSWTQAAAAVASVALLMREDSRIDTSLQRNRSSRTDSFSRAVTPFGSYAGVAVSVAALGGGLLFRNAELRDVGRDAVEAEILAAGIVTPILKKVTGRLRPSQGSDADEYQPLSQGQSFPSGHSTEAFAVASVVAARSNGWAVPALAYALASGVALARMNDRAHFASDVVAGAIIGTAIGHSVVHRHSSDSGKVSAWNLVPIAARRGAGIGIRLETGDRR
jgi:PAP2 superfamily